ncbi:MAG: AMP-binding protein [Planctomycetia bacterium]|nr:AMP-binding protein [Planctomycetia bacterium]
MLTGELLRQTRVRAPHKTALVFGEQRWTYAELDDATDRVAASMAAAGVRADDRVALFMPNCPELLFSYLACFKLGAIAVPLNHRYRQPEAQYALSHSGSTTLVVHADRTGDVTDIPFGEIGVARVYLVGGKADDDRFHPFASLLDDDRGAPPKPSFDHRQLATIMYTSGTTARPKGVVHSQQTLWRCAQIQAASMQYTADDVPLISTSASHCAATYGLLFPNILAGGTAVMLDAPTPDEVVQAIAAHRVTRCQMLPSDLEDLVEYLEGHKADLSSLRSFFCGGDVVPLDTHRRFRAIVGWDLSELCGMTETVTYAVNPPFGEKRLGSAGKPVVDTEVKIVDEHGSDLLTDETGEILIRSPANMVGYWNDTLHTAATMHDGWLASGDLGRLDGEGYLWFVGRKKQIIIRGGSNISPLEVEEAIDQHAAVHMSGVVGLPDKRLGQRVMAYVAFRHDAAAKPSEAELREFVAARIAAYKVPERFIILPELPLGATGKVDRRKLGERLASDLSRT